MADKQGITYQHPEDAAGNPAGGYTEGLGFRIDWQNGPLVDPETGERREPNGAFVETIIRACINRIEHYQVASGGRFACRENALAITKLQEAAHWLDHRTADREARGVEGTHER